MTNSKLLLALVGGLAMPLGALAGALGDPLPQPGYDVPTYQEQIQHDQMSMRTGAEGSPGMTMFDRLDTNKDGILNRDEAANSATVNRDFSTLDQDADGKISHEEWKAGGGM